MPTFIKLIRPCLLSLSCCFSYFLAIQSAATEFEFTPYVGQMVSSNTLTDDTNTGLSISDDVHYGLGLAWKESIRGQGQILINYVNHDVNSEVGSRNSVEIIHAHFSGIGHYGRRGYITTFGLGFGATYLKTNENHGYYPSATVALGTRYNTSENLTFLTELRAYATILDDDNDLFCKDSACFAVIDSSIWVDTSISVGFAYKF